MSENIKNIILSLLTLSGMLALFSIAVGYKAEFSSHSPDIRLESRSGNYFINTSCIEEIIRENTAADEGGPINRDVLEQMHHILESIAFVENVKTYRTITGKLGAEVNLRNPVMRVVNNANESFYVDERGYMFPLSDVHTARIMIVTGDIPTAFSPGANILHAQSECDDPDAKTFVGLFETASFIHGDIFWKAFIDHIYVLPNGKIELIPKNAYHTIEFGRPEHIREKFRKLRIFYIHGLTGKGWHYYNRINLEYNNQIICSK